MNRYNQVPHLTQDTKFSLKYETYVNFAYGDRKSELRGVGGEK